MQRRERPPFSKILILTPGFLTSLQPLVTRTVSFPRKTGAGRKFKIALSCTMEKRNKPLVSFDNSEFPFLNWAM